MQKTENGLNVEIYQVSSKMFSLLHRFDIKFGSSDVEPIAGEILSLKGNHEYIYVVVTAKNMFMRIDELIGELITDLVQSRTRKYLITQDVINAV
jgi:hypothetical protein